MLRYIKGYLDVGEDDEMKADPGRERERTGRRQIRAEERVKSDTLVVAPVSDAVSKNSIMDLEEHI